MKTFPDPLEQSQPPTPELLAQFARQSAAAYKEMQEEPKESWEDYGKRMKEEMSRQQPLTSERFFRNCSPEVLKPAPAISGKKDRKA